MSMNSFVGPLLVRPCLVSNCGGCTEGTAKRIQAGAKWEDSFWLIQFPASRGKGGKETYTITGLDFVIHIVYSHSPKPPPLG
jgi:hypothetical protein